jgi:hypothetical protein
VFLFCIFGLDDDDLKETKKENETPARCTNSGEKTEDGRKETIPHQFIHQKISPKKPSTQT